MRGPRNNAPTPSRWRIRPWAGAILVGIAATGAWSTSSYRDSVNPDALVSMAVQQTVRHLTESDDARGKVISVLSSPSWIGGPGSVQVRIECPSGTLSRVWDWHFTSNGRIELSVPLSEYTELTVSRPGDSPAVHICNPFRLGA